MIIKILYDETNKKEAIKLYNSVNDIAKEANDYLGMMISIIFEKIQDTSQQIQTPVIFVNNKKVVEGKIPNKKQLRNLIWQ